MTQMNLFDQPKRTFTPQRWECAKCPNEGNFPLVAGVCTNCHVSEPVERTDCKCGKNRPPLMNYTDHETGERFKFCYHCDTHETPEHRAMLYEPHKQRQPAYRPGSNL